MPRKAKNIETQLLGEEDAQYFSLPTAANFSLSDFSLDDEQSTLKKTVEVLEGGEAMEFLGLPKRPLNYLKRGDYGRIHRKFRALFNEWEERVAKDRTKSINPDVHFWKNIRIRVWNKANLEKLSPLEVIGKECPAYPAAGIEASRYQGDEYDGNAISTFLSETRNSERPGEFFVQLVRVNVTEDMKNYA